MDATAGAVPLSPQRYSGGAFSTLLDELEVR